ncbi:hypothetical protein Pst134EA_029378 [Puccinia striiformis f. sp. tritici]|uniref:hypothetical protein n=1 Tax=Puccinia striiformis f. sp. tritici TaxID=168172 RepID=UPI002008BFD9|nr:hypothetical protein Pst134EA_029378 [Puccinia striiformis f. sp. tritici]KAH9447339.1 hypothetical protein Pst134EA_029378 [Puccinia striiformis f. sp. tritici]
MPPEVAEVFGRISLFLRNTTAIEDNAPDDSQLALIETASTPSHSPVSAATLNEPTVQAATVFLEPVKSDTPPSSTLKITETDLNSETARAIDQGTAQKIDTMELKSMSQPPTTELKPKEWIAYKDARYTILEKDNSSIKVYLEYDDIGLVQAAMHLNIALNSGLARLKRRAAMLPRSKRDEKPHMVHSDWFAETHTAAIYYDGKILTCKCKSPPDALEQAQKLKELVQFSSQKNK